jgi:hypothetical protein
LALRTSTSKAANEAFLTALSAIDPAFVRVAVDRIHKQVKAPEAVDGLKQSAADEIVGQQPIEVHVERARPAGLARTTTSS